MHPLLRGPMARTITEDRGRAAAGAPANLTLDDVARLRARRRPATALDSLQSRTAGPLSA